MEVDARSMTIRKHLRAVAAAALLAAAPALSQEEAAATDGSFSGSVVSASSGAPIEGALLTFSGGRWPRYAVSDETGGFLVALPAGTYALSVSHSSYASPADREITIQAGVEISLTISLSRQPSMARQAMEEIVVLGTYRPTALTRSRDSESVVDVLSSEDFAITGDSSAVDALARVPGLTVVDSKYVYVRGLGERYSNTVFNGSPLPSPDPTRRVIPMDMFPTGALENVDIQKTFSPRLPGDFSGGLVAMATRAAPAEPVLELSVGVGGNSQATGESGLQFGGGDRDWLGMDDGTRSLPAALNRITENGAKSLNLVGDEERAMAGRSLNRDDDAEIEEIRPNASISARWGGGTQINGSDLGFLLSARYSNDWTYRDEERRTFGLSGAGGELSVLDEGAQSRTRNVIDLSLLGNADPVLPLRAVQRGREPLRLFRHRPVQRAQLGGSGGRGDELRAEFLHADRIRSGVRRRDRGGTVLPRQGARLLFPPLPVPHRLFAQQPSHPAGPDARADLRRRADRRRPVGIAGNHAAHGQLHGRPHPGGGLLDGGPEPRHELAMDVRRALRGFHPKRDHLRADRPRPPERARTG